MTVRNLPGEFTGSRLIEHSMAPFNVRRVTVIDEGQEIGRHTHDHAHLMLVLAGAYRRHERGGADVIRPPFLLFDPAGTTHDDCFALREGSFVSLSIMNEVEAPVPDEPRLLRRAEAIRAALELARGVQSADTVTLEGAAWELLSQMDDEPGSVTTPSWARDAYDFVMDEAADPEISIAAIAASSNVHPVHLARVFRRAWGITPAELLRWRRIERAAELLRKRDMPAAQIAVSVGFFDQSHMTRAFRAHFGAAPSQWQRAPMLRESKIVNLGAG